MRNLVIVLLLLALAAFLIAPFVWMVLVSLHPPQSPLPPLAQIVPRGDHGEIAPQWKNYSIVLLDPDLPVSRFFANSLFVTLSVLTGQLLVSSLAAFGFSRLRFRGRDAIFWLFLGSMMFAGPVVQIPVYLMMKEFHWLDTYWVLIVPGLSSSFTIFMLRQFFQQVPRELDEAARVDGAGWFTVYWRVVMPLSRAAIATAGAFTFFATWTDFFNPMIYTNSVDMRTLEVGLSIFKNSYGGNEWPLQMAAAVVVMAPLLIVFLLTQRYFTKGLMLGGLK